MRAAPPPPAPAPGPLRDPQGPGPSRLCPGSRPHPRAAASLGPRDDEDSGGGADGGAGRRGGPRFPGPPSASQLGVRAGAGGRGRRREGALASVGKDVTTRPVGRQHPVLPGETRPPRVRAPLGSSSVTWRETQLREVFSDVSIHQHRPEALRERRRPGPAPECPVQRGGRGHRESAFLASSPAIPMLRPSDHTPSSVRRGQRSPPHGGRAYRTRLNTCVASSENTFPDVCSLKMLRKSRYRLRALMSLCL